MPTKHDVKISSVVDFLKLLDDNDVDLPKAYRGQSERGWDIIPSIRRFAAKTKTVTVSPEHTDWRGFEKVLTDEFKKQTVPYMQPKPKGRIEELVQAQHYGLPTMLIDWTTNPLKALFFAVEDMNYNDKEGEVFVAWTVFSPIDRNGNLPTALPDLINCFESNHINERIIAQEGCFSIHPFPRIGSDFLAISRDLRSDKSDVTILYHVHIPAGDKSKIRSELDKLGINKKTLFPGIDSIAESIRRTHIDGYF